MAKSVVVVGGGTAGWMTACYLKAAFGDRVRITLVESPGVETIGVGEATFSTMRSFFEYIGLAEHEWMPPCRATYKLAIKFRGWSEPGIDFYHPFERLPVVDGFTLADWWISMGGVDDFGRSVFLAAALCDGVRSPRHLDGSLVADLGRDDSLSRSTPDDETVQYPYGYHFDATHLAKLLARHGIGQGVEHIVDEIAHVRLDARGWISHLVGSSGRHFDADLYVDCTGFRGVLVNGALHEPFISFADTLPNDRAVVCRVPREDPSTIQPFTTATAAAAGWIWSIPLFDGISAGYVYSSRYSSEDEAERIFRSFVGRGDEDVATKHIGMRVGRSRNTWVNNCVAVGLAAGFVEPLESTGLFLVQHGIEQLVKNWPGAQWDDGLRRSYNAQMANCIDGIREFLALHYHASARRDNDYWQDAKRRPLPDGLRERMAYWHTKLPDRDSVYLPYHGFDPYSYSCMLLGLGEVPCPPRPALQLLDPAAAKRALESIRQRGRSLVGALPSHYDYLAHQQLLYEGSMTQSLNGRPGNGHTLDITGRTARQGPPANTTVGRER